MTGIKETQEALQFLGSFVTVTDGVLADGKVDALELVGYVNTIFTIKPAVEGIKAVPLELADLTDAERESLKNTLATSLKLRRAEVEEISEEGFELALRLVQFINKVGKVKRPAA